MRASWRIILFTVYTGLLFPTVCLSQFGFNYRPVITGQRPLTVNQGSSITIQFSDITVVDFDDTYPQGFTMEITDRSNYDVEGTTVTPRASFLGTLVVPITVNDGQDDSRRFDLQISVIEVPNVPPTITGQTPLTITQGESITLTLNHLTVSDPDNDYPNGFSLEVLSGANYNVSSNTHVTPSPSFIGTLTVKVRVSDGEDESPTFDLTITVKAKNVAPVITGQSKLGTYMNTPLTISLNHLTVNDPDNLYPNDFTLKVLAGPNYKVSGNTVTPATNYLGNISVKVTVNDGVAESPVFNLTVTVVRANVAPVITGQTPLSTNGNTPITITLSNLTVNDPDNDYPGDFTLLVLGGTNYTVSGAKVTPATNFEGQLTVGVRVSDGTAESSTFNLKITVLHINVAPTITGQAALSTNENTPLTISLANLTVSDPDNKYPENFTLLILPGTNYTVSGAKITPASNFEGELTVGVRVSDGKAESPTFNLKIMVLHVNVAPVITGQVALTTNEETAIGILLTHLKVTDPDDKYPEGFTLKINPGNSYTVSGSTVTPSVNFTGPLLVGVNVNDGESNSAIFNLQIQVAPVNDAPVITGQVPLAINEDTSLPLLLSHLKVTDPDNTYPNGFTLQILPGINYTINQNVIIPTPNYSGNLTVGVTVSDGVAVSKQFNLVIAVNSVVDAPEIIKLETSPGAYLLGKGPVAFSEQVEIIDPEQDSIAYAELGFVEGNYRQGNDVLMYDDSKTKAVQGAFDANRGVLILIGKAKPAYYTDAIRAIRYDYITSEDNPLLDSAKRIYLFVSDGQARSATKERSFHMISSIKLDIPNCFTPNGDMANDTWRIRSTNTLDDYEEALVRVYNIRGMVVYEATGLDHEWDGKYKDALLPSDTYYYTINLNLEYTRATYQGIVTILR